MKPAFCKLGRAALISLACIAAACGGGNDVGSPASSAGSGPGSGAGTVQPGPIVGGADSPCPQSRVPGGHDYHGLTLNFCDFSKVDLTGANFNGATLNGINFNFANLTDADFSNATITADGTSYFVGANLINTKFIKTVFAAPTLFLVAGVRCADFSQSDINNVLELGDSLREDDQRAGCRTKFQNAKMNCTFVDKWKFLDLTGADIAACADQVKPVAGQPGRDFSGGIFSQVAFDDFDLTGSKWDGALLDHARFQGATLDNATGLNGTVGSPSRLSAVKFNKASLQNVDLSNAQLYGAQFTDANLSNSSLAGSFLSANTGATPPIESAAVFDGAHLKNVNLAGAQLMGASFLYASLYGAYGGSTPAFPCQSNTSQCSAGGRTGFTCGCATASGANLTGADFSNAFLFGADFSGSGTIVNGTRFGSAILTGASFEGASFQVNGGAAPDFTKALLQGATFSTDANLGNAGLLNAFVDFGAASNTTGGNILYLQLSADYTRFKGWPASAAATPCVQTAYQSFTAVPGAVSLTCPNGNSTACGAGRPAPNPNVNWASGIAMATNTPVPGWYAIDSTYDPAPTDASLICRNSAVDPNW